MDQEALLSPSPLLHSELSPELAHDAPNTVASFNWLRSCLNSSVAIQRMQTRASLNAAQLECTDAARRESEPASTMAIAEHEQDRPATLHRVRQAAHEAWRTTARTAGRVAVAAGGLALANMLALTPTTIAHAISDGPSNMRAGNSQTIYQAKDGGRAVTQASVAYKKNPALYAPVVSDFTVHPTEQSARLWLGVGEIEGVGALSAVFGFAGLLGWQAWGKRRRLATANRRPGNGQMYQLQVMLGHSVARQKMRPDPAEI